MKSLRNCIICANETPRHKYCECCVKDIKRKNAATWKRNNKEKHNLHTHKARRDSDGNLKKYESQKNWLDNNKARVRGYITKKRKGIEKGTIVKSVEALKEIQMFFSTALELERTTGIPHEVDHIIPIAHPDVCGLHVPWNLQVIPRSLNRIKNNKFDYTNENKSWIEICKK